MSLQAIFDPMVRAYFKNKYGGGESDNKVWKTVEDLSSAPRMVAEGNPVALVAHNGSMILCATTANEATFTDRSGETRYLIPIPKGADSVSVETTDTKVTMMQFIGVTGSGGNYAAVFDSERGHTTSYSFEKGVADYIAINMIYEDKGAVTVPWDYDAAATTTVSFSLVSESGEDFIKTMANSEYYPLNHDTIDYVQDEAFKDNVHITEVNLPKVTSIGERAFRTCKSIESVSCSALVNLGAEAFQYCSKLNSLNFPKLRTIGNYALGSVAIKSVNLPAISIYDNAFSYCRELETVTLSNAKTMKTFVFSNCSALTTVDLGAINYFASGLFYDCTALKSVDFTNIESIGVDTFANCTSFENFCAPKVTKIHDGAFRNCTTLTKVDLPSATDVGSSVFANCSNLTAAIFRTTETVCVAALSAFDGTPMFTGQGHIYVPAAMYEYYRAGYDPAMTAAGYAGLFDIMFRKIEDYPEICG